MIVLAIVRKELSLYFSSFLFYALTAVFLALSGYLFYTNLDFYVRFGGMNLARGLWQYQLFDMRERLLVLVPLLTMRLFAEERRLGTLELLWTYPLRDGEIIAGKFLACLAIVTLMLAGTVTYPLWLSRLQPVDAGPLVAGYLGLWLLAAAFIACGLFLSALTDSQLIAGASTYGVLLFFWMITWNEAAVSEGSLRILRPFSLFDRFAVFAQGGIDTRDVSYLLFFTAAFLCATFLALDSRRWRGVRS
ncbi:MAG TPA: ABC transporter permease [Candidatus Eisenbacteria bacterium]|nr:ABC transporter permease [Candidatus Eisenbacteria bacterium]